MNMCKWFLSLAVPSFVSDFNTKNNKQKLSSIFNTNNLKNKQAKTSFI